MSHLYLSDTAIGWRPPRRPQSGADVDRHGDRVAVRFTDAESRRGRWLWLGRDDARALARALLAALGEEADGG